MSNAAETNTANAQASADADNQKTNADQTQGTQTNTESAKAEEVGSGLPWGKIAAYGAGAAAVLGLGYLGYRNKETVMAAGKTAANTVAGWFGTTTAATPEAVAAEVTSILKK